MSVDSLPADAVLETKSDDELAFMVQKGCEDAFGELTKRCAVMIQAQAARLRSEWVDAEDLGQEGLLGLFAAARSYRPEGGAAFRTYAQICVRRRMISAAKRTYTVCHPGQLGEESPEEGDIPPSLASGQADPAQLLVEQEDTAVLRGRLRELLTELEYEVLMLHLGAYTYDEIAGRLHVGTKSVDNALQRIRRKLASVPLSDG